MTSGYDRVISGDELAVGTGAVGLLIPITYTTAASGGNCVDAATPAPVSVIRGPDEPSGQADDPLLRCGGLIAEAIIFASECQGRPIPSSRQ